MITLPQQITWWTAQPDGNGGKTFGTPKTIKGRWQTEDKLIVSKDTEGVEYQHTVFIDTDVNIGDYLYLGTSIIADPTTIGGLEVKYFSNFPNRTATKYVKRALL